MADAFPGREIVPVPALEIANGGGCIHCITQQQPATSVELPLLERVRRLNQTTDRFA